jgi:putative transferase (TIGR04331 family)
VVSRFLCTTALEETWRDTEPVLFLGEWCRRPSRKERWSRMGVEIPPYHWDDRDRLQRDYAYLQDLHERLLHDLAAQLNRMHAVDHGPRYWRILLGPWLGYFIQILFDRWTSIQECVRGYDLSGTVVLRGGEEALVPSSMGDFARLFVDDAWNHHIYSGILTGHTNVRCVEQARQSVPPPVAATPPTRRPLKRAIATWGSRAAAALVREQDALLLSTYLPSRDEFTLQLRLRQIPQLWRPIPLVSVAVDFHQRDWSLDGEARSEFEAYARGRIPQQIPSAYLEGYSILLRQIASLPWPKRPKVIWTSNAHGIDDVFKAWAAEKVERGAPLVIGQHGGHYGSGRWSFNEDHDVAISDLYLSWGWSDPAQPKVKPVGQLKAKRPLNVRHGAQPNALLVSCVVPRFSYWMYSAIVARQWLDHFEDQCAFAGALPALIRNALQVRLYPQDFGWDQAARWRERFPDVRLDEGRVNIDALIRHSRLYISTYNATTFLESFTMNVPTVMYWNPRHWELRDSASAHFDELMRVGIFHATPESAAQHVAAVWDDIDTWWGSAPVTGALDRFKKIYCDTAPGMLGRVEQALHRVMQPAARAGVA